MGFVNEFVSEQEIAQYGLDALMKKHNERGWKWGRPPGFKHQWTIDRDRKAFLLTLKRGSQVGPSGNPQPTSQRVMWLHVDGRDYHFGIDRSDSEPASTDPSTVHIVWRIVSVPESLRAALPTDRAEIEALFREAVIAYGNFGAWHQVPNTVVSFVN